MTSTTMPLSGGDYILDEQGLRRVEAPAASRSMAALDQGAAAAAPSSGPAPTTRAPSRARGQRRTSSS